MPKIDTSLQFPEIITKPFIPTKQKMLGGLKSGYGLTSGFKNINIFKPETRQDIKPIVDFEIKQQIKPMIDISLQQKPIIDVMLRQEQIIKPSVAIKSSFGVAQMPKISQSLKQDLRQDLKTDFLLMPRFKTMIKSDFDFKQIDEKPIKKIPVKLRDEQRNGYADKYYDVYVREGEKRRDRFIKANKTPLPKNKALNFGGRIVDDTVSASFKLQRSDKKVKPQQDDFNFFLADKFRQPKGKTKLPLGTWVEKNNYRIDSLGELQGIPFSSRKNKNLLGGMI